MQTQPHVYFNVLTQDKPKGDPLIDKQLHSTTSGTQKKNPPTLQWPWQKITILNSRPAVPHGCHIRKGPPCLLESLWILVGRGWVCGLGKGRVNLSHHKGDFSRRMTGTFNPVSEGNQRMRRRVCEPPFVEDLPPSSDREGASKGNQRRWFPLLHGRLQGSGRRGEVVPPPRPKGALKVQTANLIT